MNRISLNVKSQGTKKNRGFSKSFRNKLTTPENVRRETLYISVYECVDISTFALSDVNQCGWKKMATLTHITFYIHSDLFSRGLKIDI